jgi:hypothetical protein
LQKAGLFIYNFLMPGETTSHQGSSPAPYDVGDRVQDFCLPLLDGGEGCLSDYRGKYVILFFMATW